MATAPTHSGNQVLVAGIGNVFLGDDGFGVAVAARLGEQPVPDGVRVIDFGIRGVHLAYELLRGYDGLVIVDAVPMGASPGTVAILDAGGPALPDIALACGPMDAHAMGPATVLETLARLGGHVDRVLVVACEPATIDESMALSEVVAASVEPAAAAALEVATRLASGAEPVPRTAGQLT